MLMQMDSPSQKPELTQKKPELARKITRPHTGKTRTQAQPPTPPTTNPHTHNRTSHLKACSPSLVFNFSVRSNFASSQVFRTFGRWLK